MGRCPRGSRHFVPKQEAYRLLKHHTGKDFGEDFEAWHDWILQNPDSIHTSTERQQELMRKLVTAIDEDADEDSLRKRVKDTLSKLEE